MSSLVSVLSVIADVVVFVYGPQTLNQDSKDGKRGFVNHGRREDVVGLRRSATDSQQELKSCLPSVKLKRNASSRWSSSLYHPMWNSDQITIGKTHPTLAKLLFVEYILESIKRLPVLRLILIGYEKLAPCLFMFLIILESSHLFQVHKKLLFVLISSISMKFYGF